MIIWFVYNLTRQKRLTVDITNIAQVLFSLLRKKTLLSALSRRKLNYKQCMQLKIYLSFYKILLFIMFIKKRVSNYTKVIYFLILTAFILVHLINFNLYKFSYKLMI